MTHAARTALIAVVAVLAASFTVVAGTATSANAAMSAGQIQSMAPSTYEKRVHGLINKVRARHGKRKLRFQSCTDYYAERWSQHLADSQQFYHQSLDPFFRRCGARYAGETLAKGTNTPGQMVQAWMRSPGHRRVMLGGLARRVGVAAVLDSRGTWVVTADYTRF